MRQRRARPVPVVLPALAMAVGLCSVARAADTPLIEAVRGGDPAAVRTLLDRGADVDARAADGAAALHWAAYADDLAMVDLLLDAGADVAARNRAGVTPLSLAAAGADAALVERLIEAGADPDERLPGGETPLMMAARTGRVAVLAALLDRGAAVDAAEDRRGTTALMWAAANERPGAVRLLVERGADVSARSKIVPAGRGPYLAPIARDRIEDARRGVGQAGAPARTADLGDVPPQTRPGRDARYRRWHRAGKGVGRQGPGLAARRKTMAVPGRRQRPAGPARSVPSRAA